ncbi:hypothetical protein MTMN5_01963 [Marinobacter salarius]|nr:hypothetical protein MTMN5_01963 [Marinobacter salarius]
MVARQPEQGDDMLYLILEGVGNDSLLKALYEQCEAPIWELLFSETQWAPYKDESPLVIQTARGSAFYQWALKGLGKTGELRGVIIESDASLEAVLQWARARLTVTLGDTRNGLLRFYDPLVWHRLAPHDTGREGTVKRVVYWHGGPEDGSWLTSQNPEPVTMVGAPTLEAEQLQNLNLARA